MKQAIIDIGSNSMRLTLYEVGQGSFKILFKEKVMAGLAGYVEDGVLSDDGIECAYTGLLDFKETLESLDVQNTAVFATASLRNIENTQAAIAEIHAASGYQVEVIGGEEEAMFGYIGAMKELDLTDGAFVDIGGASTEVVSFEKGAAMDSASFSVGSLSLYRECVKKIIPGEGSLKRIQAAITDEIDRKSLFAFDKRSPLACVGGTARAVLKLAKKLYNLPVGGHSVSAEQFDDMCSLLYKGDRAATDLILKLEPDRIHTIVPGVMILQHVFKLFDADELVVSKYGVREGYLCKMILQSNQSGTFTPKIGN